MFSRRFVLHRLFGAAALAASCCLSTALNAEDNRSALQRPASPELLAEAGRIDRLEALTERVEAISAIKRLQHAYGHYSELSLWHDFADLFADTGIGHYTQGELDREGIRTLSIYENTSVDEDGTWKLSGMDLDYVWQAPSRGGWVRVTTPPTAPVVAMAKEFPPDSPLRGSIAAPFPKVHTVPFHYTNPVSGRVPPRLLP